MVQSLLGSMSKKDRYSDSEKSDNSDGGMFTGHDGPAAMYVYWSAAILLVIGLADKWEVLSLYL